MLGPSEKLPPTLAGPKGSAGRHQRRESAPSPPGNCGSHLLQPPDAVTSLLGPRLSLGNSLSSFNLFGNRQLCSLLIFSSFWISAAYAPVRFPCFSFGQQHQAFAVLSRHSPSSSPFARPFTLHPLPGCYRQSSTKYGCSRGIVFSASCNEEQRGGKGSSASTDPLTQPIFRVPSTVQSFIPAQRHNGPETSHARAAGSPEGKMGRHYRKCLRTDSTIVNSPCSPY